MLTTGYLLLIVGGCAIILWTVISVCYLTLATGTKREPITFDSFTIKKAVYLSMIAMINVGMSAMAFLFADQQALYIILIILKSKDVIMAFTQVVHLGYCGLRWCVNKVVTWCNSPIQSDVEITTSTRKKQTSTIVSLIPVYSEPKDQIDVTINTCIDNTDENKQLVAIICDGIDVNVQDNLTKVLHQSSEAYVSWKQKKNVLDLTYGFIKDTPCVIVKKRHNQGKKDTLIIGHDIFNVARTNMPLENVVLRESVRAQLSKLYGMETFDYMFCTDADSLIMKDSFNCLIDTIDRRKAIACCGLVVIDFSESQWSFWNIYQNFQYLFGQYVRRGTENLYGKVSCLPGCITMFKIDELAAKAIAMYAQLPQEGEMLKSIVQLLGTDRRLTSSFLYQDKSVVTAYDPRAKCYTIPPAALTSYLSQRRRWGSNAYFNTMCNIVGPNIHPFMRVFSFMDYVRMSLAYFRVFNTILFVYSLTQGVVWTNILPFIIVMLFPTTFFMIRTLFDSFTRAMYPKIIIGYVFNKACSILITLMIISNMLYNIGSAKWGGNQKDASPLEAKDPQQIVVEK